MGQLVPLALLPFDAAFQGHGLTFPLGNRASSARSLSSSSLAVMARIRAPTKLAMADAIAGGSSLGRTRRPVPAGGNAMLGDAGSFTHYAGSPRLRCNPYVIMTRPGPRPRPTIFYLPLFGLPALEAGAFSIIDISPLPVNECPLFRSFIV